MWDLSPEKASRLRSAGGSLRYDKVSELLRKTELDALIASRGTKAPGHGFYAEPDDYEPDLENDENYEDQRLLPFLGRSHPSTSRPSSSATSSKGPGHGGAAAAWCGGAGIDLT